MRLKKEYEGNVVVLSPSGYLFGGRETVEFERELTRQLGSGGRRILIDFGRTRAINTIGITMLLRIHFQVQERGARWFFCNVDKRIEEPLVIMKLIRLFNVCVTRPEALAALSQQPAEA